MIKKTAEHIWINDEFKLWEEANLHISTHSLHYSGAVYEGMRAYNGKIFLAKEHAERLIKSAHAMGLDFNYSADEIIDHSQALLEKNKISNAYIRPLVWRTSETLKMYSENLATNFMIMVVPSYKPMLDNLSLNIAKWIKPHPASIDPQAKSSAHYAMSIVVQKESKALGFDDAIQLDYEGNLAECTVSNIFFGKGDVLYTPVADNFLDGLTRQYIIKMASDIGLQVKETTIKPDQISEFDSCFMTGTSVEIASVKQVEMQNGQKIDFANKVIPALRQEFIKRTGKTENI